MLSVLQPAKSISYTAFSMSGIRDLYKTNTRPIGNVT